MEGLYSNGHCSRNQFRIMQQPTPTATSTAAAPVPTHTPQAYDAQINPHAQSENAHEAQSAPANAANAEDATAAIDATADKLGVNAGDSSLPPATLSAHAPAPAQSAQSDARPSMQRESKLKPEVEEEIMSMAMFTSKSEQVDFKDLVKPTDGSTVIVVFIRHFYCASVRLFFCVLALSDS